MANEEHLALLRQGVRTWNEWRRENPEAKPDLRGADLSDADLSDADLKEANLNGAYLGKADLTGATLTGATLTGADLTRATLIGATLHQADLTGTTLTEAILYGVDLSLADLNGANLRSAHLWETILSNLDLSRAEGLDACTHQGPSPIDYRTLRRSWPLPLEFLRGVGLPDNLIDYLPFLLNQPMQFSSCFISYSSRDDAFARRLLGQPGAGAGLDQGRGEGELLLQRVVGGPELRVLEPLLCDLLDGDELPRHVTSFARLRASSISRRGVRCVFFVNTRTTTTRRPTAVT